MTFVGVLVRVAVAGLLLFGPWTDEPAEVADWDVGRFDEIARADGMPYVDHPVEYPPGSVALIEVTHRADPSRSLKRVVLVAFAADLATAALVARRWGSGATCWYLGLGAVLLPATYLRFDAVAVALAVAGWAAADARPRRAGLALAAAFMVKTWPVLVVPSMLASGRWRAAAWTVGASAAALVAWVAWAGLDGPAQVLSFREASGWHVESTGGVLTVLTGSGHAALESGSYRVGAASLIWKVIGASAVAATVMVSSLGVWRRRVGPTDDAGDAELAALASLAVLLAASPLLSPQFLLWLVPWAAVAARRRRSRPAAVLVGGAAALTQATLTLFSPAGLDAVVPAALLGVRNAMLVAVALWSLRVLLEHPAPRPDPDGGRPARTEERPRGPARPQRGTMDPGEGRRSMRGSPDGAHEREARHNAVGADQRDP